MIKIKAYGKVNFLLRITGVDKEGYHMLDTVMASVSLCDIVSVAKRKDGEINVRCRGVRGENSAYRAAKVFQERFSTCGFDIEIVKGIPMSAGLGGSSADSAGVLWALGKMFGVEEKSLLELAEKCGSDTPFMLKGGFAKAEGRGEMLRPFSCDRVYHLVIAKPYGGVSTQKAYKMFDEMKERGEIPHNAVKSGEVTECLQSGNLDKLAEICQNDLYLSAVRLLPEIAEVKNRLEKFSPACSFMTGSGSAVAAVFDTPEKALSCSEEMKRGGYSAFYAFTKNKGIEEIEV